MQKSGKLELTWVGKYEQRIVEPRILIEDKSKSYGDPDNENMLIHGDNLIALKALEQDFAGKVKCIYIDPPYNTGSAFEHYDDGLQHSEWLCLIKPRLEILQNLLSDDGSIWISIDDDEGHYLKVLCDEIFGRHNFINTVIWEKKYSPQNDAKWLSDSHDFILIYAKNKTIWRPNLLPRSIEMNNRYRNIDNDSRGVWKPSDLSVKTYNANADYPITTPNGRIVNPPAGYCWRVSKEKFQELVNDNRIWFGTSGNNVPAIKRFLADVKDGMTAMTIWNYSDVGHNQDARKEAVVFNSDSVFATPKPERLIERVLTLATNPNDIILDSFLGSGTTAAVAHKMRRRWIGIELGDHAYTHCKARLDKVIDGEQGGISKAIGWQGGGGYKFYELAPSLLEKHFTLPVYQINKSYTFEMLCEAICKLEGFTYKPEGEMHGFSSEKKFIHIAKDYVSGKYISKLMKDVEEKQSVLIYGIKIQSGLKLPGNVEVKKIPKDLLKKCNFESEVR
ncbi:MAG: site-specific DNA-methyltransferase [Treponema sp.]|nr:site-specific DNA-methyltransferase [Treponema sp.]